MNVEMGDSHLRKQMQSSKMCLSPVYSCLKCPAFICCSLCLESSLRVRVACGASLGG